MIYREGFEKPKFSYTNKYLCFLSKLHGNQEMCLIIYKITSNDVKIYDLNDLKPKTLNIFEENRRERERIIYEGISNYEW